MSGAVHATRVDRSKETGTLVVCTCGLALGPFQDHGRALEIATAHRRLHNVDRANARQHEMRQRDRE